MESDAIIHSIFLIFTGAALIATLALYARQALPVAYIALGVLAGPWVTGFVSDTTLISGMAHVGIIFLLFLLGLDLEPQELLRMLRKATFVTFISSLAFNLAGMAICLAFGFTLMEAALIGAAMMFSSTIIGLKLLPTTALHHQHTGEIIISVLLLQDLIAIFILMILQGFEQGGDMLSDFGLLIVSVPGLILAAFLFARYVLQTLVARFDQIREYIFLLAIGWCLGIAELGSLIGLSAETGAFIGGITLATNPISRFIAESLRPLRDFFLVMFFFSLGAGLNLGMVMEVLLPSLMIAGVALALKPWLFSVLLQKSGEARNLSREVGFRLGQISEFSLLIAVLAVEASVIGERASYTIQIATILTFVVSSYLVVLRYPTPIAVSDQLRRN